MPITTIHPFQLNDKTIGDENSDPAQYRFGKLAERLAEHWRKDTSKRPDEKKGTWYFQWLDDMEEIEQGLTEYASLMMGERVKLHDDYI